MSTTGAPIGQMPYHPLTWPAPGFRPSCSPRTHSPSPGGRSAAGSSSSTITPASSIASPGSWSSVPGRGGSIRAGGRAMPSCSTIRRARRTSARRCKSSRSAPSAPTRSIRCCSGSSMCCPAPRPISSWSASSAVPGSRCPGHSSRSRCREARGAESRKGCAGASSRRASAGRSCPCSPLSLRPWTERAKPPLAAALILASIILIHPAHAPAGLVLVFLSRRRGARRPPRSNGSGRAPHARRRRPRRLLARPAARAPRDGAAAGLGRLVARRARGSDRHAAAAPRPLRRLGARVLADEARRFTRRA